MYDYERELNRLAYQERKRLSRTDKLETKQAWNKNAYGSATCAYTSMDAVLCAYAEYKENANW